MAFFIAMALHQWIFALFVANQFRVVSYLLPWVILAGGLFAVGQILSLKLMSDINTKSMIIPKILTAIIGITCNIYGAKLAGLQGVVAGLIIFSLIYFLWMIYLNFPVLKSSQTIT
jgi:O-antigen/teichoic acid export membrane protein